MKNLIHDIDKVIVKVEITGKNILRGILIDSSSELVVLFNGKEYFYIPYRHIHEIKIDYFNEDGLKIPSIDTQHKLFNGINEEMTFEKVLTNSIGTYLEVHVLNNQPLHGYISNILKDYIVFQSPIYKKLLVSMKHIKTIIPYNNNLKPYQLSDNEFFIEECNENFQDTFEAQIGNLRNKLTVLNVSEKNNFTGVITDVNGSIIEFRSAKDNFYYNIQHIKTIHTS
ncbi:hypothetical protein LZ480_11870 [Solibacillus sp. MA9]|uniref:DUF2642 domain-containing protein n=1 Tax=Solibacillus palustris TaxID=2908203 RepID=A0ABS9UE51_9BACL|nr:hypothetical protein [Solibacillus sp. MA9]MCH7322589.1 hypothetical protein [Solibacillus sp. MA9]